MSYEDSLSFSNIQKYKMIVEILHEAKKLTNAGYGGIKFGHVPIGYSYYSRWDDLDLAQKERKRNV